MSGSQSLHALHPGACCSHCHETQDPAQAAQAAQSHTAECAQAYVDPAEATACAHIHEKPPAARQRELPSDVTYECTPLAASAAAEALAALDGPVTTRGLGLMRRRSTLVMQQAPPATVLVHQGVEVDERAGIDRLQSLTPPELVHKQKQGQGERHRKPLDRHQGQGQALMGRHSSPEALREPGSPAIILCAVSTDAQSGAAAGTAGSEASGCGSRNSISDSLAIST